MLCSGQRALGEAQLEGAGGGTVQGLLPGWGGSLVQSTFHHGLPTPGGPPGSLSQFEFLRRLLGYFGRET